MNQKNNLICEICGIAAECELGIVKNGSFKRIGFCNFHKKSFSYVEKSPLKNEVVGRKILIEDIDENIKCSKCGNSLKNYCISGEEKCDRCFVEFQPSLLEIMKSSISTELTQKEDMIEKVVEEHQKIDEHRFENEEKSKKEINELNIALNKAIEIEDYEEAARIRDILKEKSK